MKFFSIYFQTFFNYSFNSHYFYSIHFKLKLFLGVRNKKSKWRHVPCSQGIHSNGVNNSKLKKPTLQGSNQANSGKWWRTGKPGMLCSWGCRVRHDLVTEQKQQIQAGARCQGSRKHAPRDATVISGAVSVGLGLWLMELFPYHLDVRQCLWKRHGRGQARCFLMKCGFLMKT